MSMMCFRASGGNDVDVARVVQSRQPPPPPPPRGGRRRRPDGETTLRRRGASVVAAASARRGVLGVLVLCERDLRSGALSRHHHRLDVAARLVSNATRTTTKGGQRTTKRARPRAVRPRQNATAAATEETVPIETTRRGVGAGESFIRAIGMKCDAKEKREEDERSTNAGMTRKKTVNRGNI